MDVMIMSTRHDLANGHAHDQHPVQRVSDRPEEPARCGRNGHSRMHTRRLAICLTILGWSAREYARRIGEHRTIVTRQLEGTSPVAADIAAWLERLVAAHLQNPCPRRRPLILAQEILQ